MKKVVFSLLDTPAFGGAEQYLYTALSFLAESGYAIVLATNNKDVQGEMEKRVKTDKLTEFKIINLPYRLDAIGNWKGLVKYFIGLPQATFWFILALIKLRKNGDVICFFPGFTDRLSFSPIVHMFHVPLIWLEYGPLEPTFARNHGFPKLLYFMVKNLPDRIITISQHTKKSLIQAGRIDRHTISIVYPGVKTYSTAQLHSLRKQGRNLLHSIGRKDFRVVVTVARLAQEKEIDLLLQAWKLYIQSSKSKCLLLIIGDGPEKEKLVQLACSLGVEKSVYFTGFISTIEKEKWLSCANLFIFPSQWELEGFGMTIVEAIALGVPVISSGSGPQKEIVIEGVNGLIFRPHTADALALKITEFFSQTTTFSIESKKLLEHSFTLNVMKKRLVSIFSDTVQSSRH